MAQANRQRRDVDGDMKRLSQSAALPGAAQCRIGSGVGQ